MVEVKELPSWSQDMMVEVKIEKEDSSNEDNCNELKNVLSAAEFQIKKEPADHVKIELTPIESKGDRSDAAGSSGDNKKTVQYKDKKSSHFYEVRPHQCEYCRQQFKTIIDLIKHVKEHGSRASKRYECRVCPASFRMKVNMNLHMIGHSMDGIHKCTDCSKIYDNQQDLIEHREVHEHSEILKCKLCLKSDFRNRADLNEHMKQEHPQGYLQCEQCLRMFSSKQSYDKHQKCHEIGPVSCQICGESFRGQQALRVHETVMHNALREFPCDVCGKIFLYNCRLTKHMKMHREKQPFPCPRCALKFHNYTHLSIHYDEEHGGPPMFPCELCPARFYCQIQLDKHNRTHKKDAVFNCKYCGKKLRSRMAYRTHIAMHEKREQYKCRFCPSVFSHKPGFFNHIRQKHSDVCKPYSCSHCDASFDWKNDLVFHLKLHHNNGVNIDGACNEINSNTEDIHETDCLTWCSIDKHAKITKNNTKKSRTDGKVKIMHKCGKISKHRKAKRDKMRSLMELSKKEVDLSTKAVEKTDDFSNNLDLVSRNTNELSEEAVNLSVTLDKVSRKTVEFSNNASSIISNRAAEVENLSKTFDDVSEKTVDLSKTANDIISNP